MTGLTGLLPSNTYTWLTVLPGPLTSTLQTLHDGAGNSSVIGLSTTQFSVNGYVLTLTGTSTLNGSFVGSMSGGGAITSNGWTLTMTGNSTVSGTNTGNNTGDQTDATLTFSDITTNNASTSKHGFLPKLNGNGGNYLDGTGSWSSPAGGGLSNPVTPSQGGTGIVNNNTHTLTLDSASELDFQGNKLSCGFSQTSLGGGHFKYIGSMTFTGPVANGSPVLWEIQGYSDSTEATVDNSWIFSGFTNSLEFIPAFQGGRSAAYIGYDNFNWILGKGTAQENNLSFSNTGSNITLTVTGTGTISGSNTGDQTPDGILGVSTNGIIKRTSTNVYSTSATLAVADGGTGQSSYTDGQLLIGKTTGNTLNKTTLTAGTGITITNGSGTITIATSGGSGLTQIGSQIFTSSGTYTPTSGMQYCIIECVGGGGGGAGATASASQQSIGGGGGGGGYSRGIFTSATVGASQTVTIGAGGTGGVAANGNGGNGGATSVGTLITANGGSGGTNPNGSLASQSLCPGGAGGSVGTGTGCLLATGQAGSPGLIVTAGSPYIQIAGNGGNSMLGGGAFGSNAANVTGAAGLQYGGGGAGAGSYNNNGGFAGGPGAAGVVFITEFK